MVIAHCADGRQRYAEAAWGDAAMHCARDAARAAPTNNEAELAAVFWALAWALVVAPLGAD
eukprot:11173063-Lingulodinium_polyedra.AAC.1